ncbi:MAG: phosphoglycerate dehydrogenase [Myxococcaceae bacterium]
MPTLKALLLENIHPSAEEMFRAQGLEVESLKAALPDDELVQRLSGVDVLGIRSKTQIPDSVLAKVPKLLSIGCFCIGTNQVDLDGANRRGVAVFNAPFSSTRSVAEMVIGEILMLARQLGDRTREVHSGQWRKVTGNTFEVRGKTLGIVGYGHIGSQVGLLAEALGMRVVFFDTGTKLPLGNTRPCKSLSELLGIADFVSLHVPATPQTENMISTGELAQMQKGTFLINASRGSVVDLTALAQALRSEHLAGAAVDVYPQEPHSNSDGFQTPLQGLANVVLTPHIGGSTAEAQEAIGREVATSLLKFVQVGASTGAVNFPQVELPHSPGTHRVLNVHRNVPGVLRDVNQIASELNANIHSQVLSTDATIGYLIMDLDQDVSQAVSERMAKLAVNIRTRVIR